MRQRRRRTRNVEPVASSKATPKATSKPTQKANASKGPQSDKAKT